MTGGNWPGFCRVVKESARLSISCQSRQCCTAGEWVGMRAGAGLFVRNVEGSGKQELNQSPLPFIDSVLAAVRAFVQQRRSRAPASLQGRVSHHLSPSARSSSLPRSLVRVIAAPPFTHPSLTSASPSPRRPCTAQAKIASALKCGPARVPTWADACGRRRPHLFGEHSMGAMVSLSATQ